jgi:hypothetical protein
MDEGSTDPSRCQELKNRCPKNPGFTVVYGGLQNTPFVNPRKNFSVIPKPFQSVSKTQSSKALEAKMGVGKPKRRPPQHNVSVTRAPPYKVSERNLKNLNPPL